MTTLRLQRSVIIAGAAAVLFGVGAVGTASPALAADAAQEAKVVELVNQARAGAGCGPVTADDRLAKAANLHSSDMSDRGYFSHTTPEGSSFSQRIEQAGYPSPGAENIAQGHTSAEQVMDGWMESPGHKQNILNCSLKTIGVGVDAEGWYWTQDFGF